MHHTILTTLAAATLVVTPAAHAAPAANPSSVQSGSYTVEPYHTRVAFVVDHMGFTNWYGDFTGVTGTLELDAKAPAHSQVAITMPTSSIATTNAKLDEELRAADWLDAAAFPRISFVSARVVSAGKGAARIYGTLTLHGVSRPVVLAAKFHGAGTNPMSKAYTVGFDATAHILRSDFGVTKYLPLIGDKVDIVISAAFERKAG